LLNAASFTPTLPSPIEGEDFPERSNSPRTARVDLAEIRKYHAAEHA
jgi:hypothetical protein